MSKKAIPLNETLVIARKDAGLTQRELAKRAGITPVHLCNLEKGKGSASLATLYTLAKECGYELRVTMVKKKDE